GARGAVAEALRGVRRAHEPHERHRLGGVRGTSLHVRTEVLIIGAGHSGLAMSRRLTEHGVEHVVLDRGEPGNAWRTERWESLRLLTPNRQTGLPGHDYAGHDPDGPLCPREVADQPAAYARVLGAPVPSAA